LHGVEPLFNLATGFLGLGERHSLSLIRKHGDDVQFLDFELHEVVEAGLQVLLDHI